QVERAVKETSVTSVQGDGSSGLPFKTCAERLNIESRVELANESPSAGTQCLPSKVEDQARRFRSQPIQDIGKVDEIEGVRPPLEGFGHAGECPPHFGHTFWFGRTQPWIHHARRELSLQHLPEIRIVGCWERRE